MKNHFLKIIYVCIIMMFSIFTSTAQVVYTDIIPDDTVRCFLRPTFIANCIDSINLDINNDGNMDFNLVFERFQGTDANNCYYYYEYASVSPIDNNSFYGIVSSNPSALNYSNIIDSNLIWSNDIGKLRYYNYDSCISPVIDTSGNWGLETDEYLPVKISITGNNFYGWIRMQMDTSGIPENGFVLKDYAFNSTPNQFILAGDTGTVRSGLIKIFTSSIALFPNPAKDKLTITFERNYQNVDLIITDITGKIVYSTQENETDKIKLNLNDFADGVYLVQVRSGNLIGIKKLVVID